MYIYIYTPVKLTQLAGKSPPCLDGIFPGKDGDFHGLNLVSFRDLYTQLINGWNLDLVFFRISCHPSNDVQRRHPLAPLQKRSAHGRMPEPRQDPPGLSYGFFPGLPSWLTTPPVKSRNFGRRDSCDRNSLEGKISSTGTRKFFQNHNPSGGRWC